MTETVVNNPKDTLEAAARWHARLSGEQATEADWIDFTLWLEADPAHRTAYDTVEDMLLVLDDAPKAEIAVSQVIDARHRFGRVRYWAAGIAAAAAVFLAVVVAGPFGSVPIPAAELVYATAVGEQRNVTLADGSMVHLNTDTILHVRFEEGARRTELEHGQAVFEVAKNSQRPFYVALGDRQVRVVGTKFDILRDEGRVRVGVAEGIVEVGPADAASAAATERLTRGMQLTHHEGKGDAHVENVDADSILAWTAGQLMYDHQTLGRVAADLNRYFKRPVIVEGGAEVLVFSGVLSTADQDAAVAALTAGLDVTVTKGEDAIVITPAK